MSVAVVDWIDHDVRTDIVVVQHHPDRGPMRSPKCCIVAITDIIWCFGDIRIADRRDIEHHAVRYLFDQNQKVGVDAEHQQSQ